MLTNLFLIIPLLVIRGLLNLLPASSGLSSNITTGISTFVGYMNAVSYFFPIGTLFTVVALTFAFDSLEQIWKLIGWIIRKIPGMK